MVGGGTPFYFLHQGLVLLLNVRVFASLLPCLLQRLTSANAARNKVLTLVIFVELGVPSRLRKEQI